ncbi:LysR family transcriptional regulator [Pinirhizobacter sp.]|jgi:LysR family transcriptional regulator for bpeEF and oprC|uniref:LysR family transcriptional regulator n=1 Tax=Pinirhizobacter sp. TaxID=2950432 RepID=UPI002F3F88FF
MEDFSAITAFVRVVESKGFSAAAPKLGMTPSGVSRAIARLEETLGARLFFRSTRALRLTDDGSAFYERCKQILLDLAEATEALGESRSCPSGKLRVGVAVSIGRAVLMQNLADFEEKYPAIRLDLSMCDYPYDLNEEGIDCAIRIGDLPDSNLIARKLGYLRNVLFASPAYLAKHGRPTSIEDLQNHRLVRHISPSTGKPTAWCLETSEGRIEVDYEPHMLINDGESVIQAAVNDLGIIYAPHCMAACMVAKGMLEVVLPELVCTGSPVWIVYPQKRHLSARVQAFIGWVDALFSRTNEPSCAVSFAKDPPSAYATELAAADAATGRNIQVTEDEPDMAAA